MFSFINFLRAIAAVIITNSHYTGIYPTDLIANGGLLGDVIFFAVSGFCIANIKLRFDKWYLKRILRIYPAVWITTAVYLLFGLYRLEEVNAGAIIKCFIYPTKYHFVASIMVIYIIFYAAIILKRRYKWLSINKIILFTAIVWILIYIFFYDKKSYHIDNVREDMIRFLFFEAMLIGARYREMKPPQNRIVDWILMLIFAAIYFASKLAFVKIPGISSFQIANQMILLVLLYSIFKCFMGIEKFLNGLAPWFINFVNYISKITLEIYVVQYGILSSIKSLGLTFPINWIVLTASIFALASVIHLLVIQIDKINDRWLTKI